MPRKIVKKFFNTKERAKKMGERFLPTLLTLNLIL